VRLNRYLAAAGFGSRRSCEQFILDGLVTVNGHVITNLATLVSPEDDVRVGKKVARAAATAHILLHKPAGFVSTRSDERGRKTVFDLVPDVYGHLFHVGRLDKESEGLLLLTNDGALAQRLTHPSHSVEKEYEVHLDRPFDKAHIEKLTRGFHIEGGRARVERIRVISSSKVQVVLRQGIKRQIRQMFYMLGYEVERLVRTRIGNLRIGLLRPGEWKALSAKDIAKLEAPVRETSERKSSVRPRTRRDS
jgi:23S rRNA pseudouridine2605 synthase